MNDRDLERRIARLEASLAHLPAPEHVLDYYLVERFKRGLTTVKDADLALSRDPFFNFLCSEQLREKILQRMHAPRAMVEPHRCSLLEAVAVVLVHGWNGELSGPYQQRIRDLAKTAEYGNLVGRAGAQILLRAVETRADELNLWATTGVLPGDQATATPPDAHTITNERTAPDNTGQPPEHL